MTFVARCGFDAPDVAAHNNQRQIGMTYVGLHAINMYIFIVSVLRAPVD